MQRLISFTHQVEGQKLEIEHNEDEEGLNLRIPGGVVDSVLPPYLVDNWNAHGAQGGSDLEY